MCVVCVHVYVRVRACVRVGHVRVYVKISN